MTESVKVVVLILKLYPEDQIEVYTVNSKLKGNSEKLH